MAQHYKPYVLTLTEEQTMWIKKSSKEFRLKATEFVRTMIDYLRESDIKELKTRMQRRQLETELENVREKAETYTKQREKLEQQLETLTA